MWAIILTERCRRALGEYEKMDAAGHRSLFQQCIAQIAAVRFSVKKSYLKKNR